MIQMIMITTLEIIIEKKNCNLEIGRKQWRNGATVAVDAVQ